MVFKTKKLVPAFVMALSIFSLSGSPALAQTWPAKSIKIIVPLPPSGPVDAVTRDFARHLSEIVKQPVIIENVAGAYGQIGLQRLNRADPDGYTIGVAASGMMVFSPLLETKLPYDTIEGFTPLTLMLDYDNVLVTHPSLPAKSISELAQFAKNNPGKITYASSGYGSSNHLSGELLAQKTGANLLHVPYKGTAPGRTDLIAGHVSLMFDVISSAKPFIDSGQVKALATTGKKRNKTLPDVPAVAETYPDFEVTGWFALFGPPNMPASITKPLSEAISKALQNKEFMAMLTNSGYDPLVSTSNELKERIKSDLKYWKPVIDSVKKSSPPK